MQTNTITRLTALADKIHGASIRLCGEVVSVGQIALVGRNGQFRLAMEIFIEDPALNGKCPDCGSDHADCPKQLASTAIAKLALEGNSGDFILDSTFRGENGRYTAKLQGTKSRHGYVGEGETLVDAIAAAVAKSFQPA